MMANEKEFGKIYEVNGAKYTVYSDGTIVSAKGKDIKHRSNSDGYASVTLGSKGHRATKRVHRIVGILFVPNPNNYPEASNLEWVMHQENVRRAWIKGSYKGRIVGEKNPKAKQNEEMVRQLRSEYNNGLAISDLAYRYGIPWSTVGNIVHRNTWKHVV